MKEFAGAEQFAVECVEELSILDIERIIQRKCVALSNFWSFNVKDLVDLIKLYNLYESEVSEEIINNIFSTLENKRIDRIKCILENSKLAEHDTEKVLKDLEQLCYKIGLRMER